MPETRRRLWSLLEKRWGTSRKNEAVASRSALPSDCESSFNFKHHLVLGHVVAGPDVYFDHFAGYMGADLILHFHGLKDKDGFPFLDDCFFIPAHLLVLT